MTNEKILIVEDKGIIAENLKNKLEKIGYTVKDIVTSGEEAIKKALESPQPDLILMDIRLDGDIDGIDAANHIRKKLKIPVIYVTAYTDDETLKRASITESYGYVVKPFKLTELRANIEMALYKHKAEKELEGYRYDLEKLVKERTIKLISANKKLRLEIKNRKKAEEETKRMKDNLQNIIDSASEVIISVDKDFKIQIWNKRAELITGYKAKGVVGKNISRLPVFSDSNGFRNNILGIIQGEKPYDDKIFLNTTTLDSRIIKASCSIIYGENDKFQGVLFVGNDITLDSERHAKLLLGNSYFILGKNNKSAIDFFTSLCRVDHKGLIVTRLIPPILKKTTYNNINIVLLSEHKFDGFKNISEINDLIKEIEEFCSKNRNLVILLDDIHYFLTRFYFHDFMNMIYSLREIIFKYKSIFLLYLDELILEERQLAILKKELLPLPDQSVDNVVIGDDLFNMLTYIYNLNVTNNVVNINKVALNFSIVGKTVTKRLRTLEKEGLINIRKQGRLKLIYVSEKGKTLLNKRQII
jgi:PAS domain S-box-containing protein